MGEPQKFRKKPVIIEAVRLPEDGVGDSHDRVDAMAEWCGGRAITHGIAEPWSIDIDTLEGTMRADPGDWIIRGVKGEFYPCTPDIFAATYEPATESRDDA